MKTSRARLTFLAEASALLDRSLDPTTTMKQIAGLAVPRLGELCVIDLLQEDGRIAGAVAAVAEDAALASTLEQLRERYPLDPAGQHPVARVLREGRSALLPELPDDVLVEIAQSDEHLEFMRRVSYRSAVVAPLRARGHTLGALSVLHIAGERRYDADDLALVEELARRAAMALDNARLYRGRNLIAETLEQSLLPPRLPGVPGVEIAARYWPAGDHNEVGGDFYDVFELDGAWGFVIGDVCGKGAEAAALTALTRYTIRALAPTEPRPSGVLRQLNGAILRQRDDSRFCTAIYARLELSPRGRMRLSNGGHPPALRMRRDGEIEALPGGGDLLGVFPDPRLTDFDVQLDCGDTLILYTDGVTEARAPQRILETRHLAQALAGHAGAKPGELVEVIESTAARGDQPRDDLALLVLRIEH